MPKFRDIPQRIGFGSYQVNQSWQFLEQWIQEQNEEANLDLDPDFQRQHVWKDAQQIAYVEFILSGGNTAKQILFNSPGWLSGHGEQYLVIVDGKQRLNAVRQFLGDHLKVFGHRFSEYSDKLPRHAEFIICINELQTRAELLQWYLELNSGGTPHTNAELEYVQKLLNIENQQNLS